MMHRRVQDGGWTRQVNVRDFPISTQIAGREHAAHRRRHPRAALAQGERMGADAQRQLPTDRARISTVGRMWTTSPQAIFGIFRPACRTRCRDSDPDGCEFLLVFDDGRLLRGRHHAAVRLDDPHAARSGGQELGRGQRMRSIRSRPSPRTAATFSRRRCRHRSSRTSRRSPATGARQRRPLQFRMMQMKPQKSTKGGEVRIVDSTNFPAAANIAMAHVTLKPGALRELHWHPNADEWQYYIQGSGRMTVFFNSSTARTIDFPPRRRRLRPADAGTLHREYRRHRFRVPGNVQDTSLPGLLAQRLADPHSAGIGDRSLGDFAADAGRNSESQLRGAAGVMRRHSGARLTAATRNP